MNVPFLLAPMAELSHRALRELIEGFGGCDGYYTEMISAAALLAGGPFEKWYMDNGPCPCKLIYQLIGADPVYIAKAAAVLDRQECAGIDLNMGCSAPLIRKTGAGVAWMASIDRAGELVKIVRKTVKRRLSVKIRTGLTDDFDYLLRFCRRLADEGVEFIVLHPRTAREKFKRTAKWDYVGALRAELRIPVAGNGDIETTEDLIRRANGPCDAVMAGRAAVRQPWIFSDKKVTDTIIEETGLRFLELLAMYQPPEFYLSRARRFFGFYCNNLKWGAYLKNRLNRAETLSDMEQIWRMHFREEFTACSACKNGQID